MTSPTKTIMSVLKVSTDIITNIPIMSVSTFKIVVILYLSVIHTFFLCSHRAIFSDINGMTMILKIIGQCDVKHIMTLLIKTITSVLKVSTHIITSLLACPVRLAAILAIMSVSTFKTAVIL